MNNKKILGISALIMVITLVLYAQDDSTTNNALDNTSIFRTENNLTLDQVSYHMDWSTLMLNTNIHIAWVPDSLNQYIYYKESLYMAESSFPQIFVEISQYLMISEQDSLLDFSQKHSLYRTILSEVLGNTFPSSEIPSKNLAGTDTYFVTSMTPLLNKIVFPSFNQRSIPYTPQTIPDNTPYTSIIVAVNNPIAIIQDQKKKAMYTPKALPKIYSNDMTTLLYSPEYFNNTLIIENRPYTYLYAHTYQDTDTGKFPFFILPEYLSDAVYGDLVLNTTDTNSMLSSQTIQTLIKEGRIFFIIQQPDTQTLQ